MTDSARRLGPIFYAIKVAKRSDNATVYFGDTLGEGRRYHRTFLDEAARYIDRERAEIHLDASREIGPEIVTLYGVTHPGDWRGWHVTEEDGERILNGPRGETIRETPPSSGMRSHRFPWICHWPEDGPLTDERGRLRFFSSPMAARKAIGRALRQQHQRHVDEANKRSQTARG
jgi:hypothetical protein